MEQTMRFVTLVFVMAASVGLVAQDAIKTLPANYKLQFENDYVRVTRVHYAAKAKLPPHTHTSLATAYVYLSDSGPVAFKHVGADYGVVTRQPVMARSFRLYRGVEEIHEVENLGSIASDFLRVEFKTDPVEPRTLRGKFLPEPTFSDALQKVQFENAQVKITRLYWPRNKTIAITDTANPSLLISFTDGDMGNLTWLAKGQAETLTNTTLPAMEAIRIEFRTAPLSSY
jgi:hypothetical protein